MTATDRIPPAFVEIAQEDGKRRIAYRAFKGRAPSLVWLGGFRSDMLGSKAERLSQVALADGIGFCRFDYSGHGESSGAFVEGTISLWLEDARAVIDAVVEPPFILVGSSMGAWIALRLAAELRKEGRGRDLAGLVLLAPAPDFTRRLVEPKLDAAQRLDLEIRGYFSEPSLYSEEPTIYTRSLMEDGLRNLVMEDVIETGCRVHIIQGMADTDVPYTHALDLLALIPADGVVLTLIRDGDHRLSREEDLGKIEVAVRDLIGAVRDDREETCHTIEAQP